MWEAGAKLPASPFDFLREYKRSCAASLSGSHLPMFGNVLAEPASTHAQRRNPRVDTAKARDVDYFMVQEKRDPVTYTDEFRRSKRGVLLWSGLTIAATLGETRHPGDPATLSFLGSNLVYDQNEIVGFCAVVAVIMAIGFVQSIRRLLTFAKPHFYEKTDIREAFLSLGEKVSATHANLDGVRSSFEKVATTASKSLDSVVQICSQIYVASADNPVPDEPIRFPEQSAAKLNNDPLGELQQDNVNLRLWGKELKRTVDANRVSLQGVADRASIQLQQAQEQIQALTGSFVDEQRAVVDGEVEKFRNEVMRINRMQDRIALEDRGWLWIWDISVPMIACLAALFIAFDQIVDPSPPWAKLFSAPLLPLQSS